MVGRSPAELVEFRKKLLYFKENTIYVLDKVSVQFQCIANNTGPKNKDRAKSIHMVGTDRPEATMIYSGIRRLLLLLINMLFLLILEGFWHEIMYLDITYKLCLQVCMLLTSHVGMS